LNAPIQVPFTKKLSLQPLEGNFESDLSLKTVLKAFSASVVIDLSQYNLELLPSSNVFVKGPDRWASYTG